MATDHLSSNYFTTDWLRIHVEITIPRNWSLSDYELWAEVLTEKLSWSLEEEPELLNTLEAHERLFIMSFLTLSRLLLELGRLPIFRNPVVLSIKPKEQVFDQYFLELGLPLVQFLPQTAYQIPFRAALNLCMWMAENAPEQQNKHKVFNTIKQQVIKPLWRLDSGGKSTIPVLKVADFLGIPFIHLGLGVYQLGWGSKARRLDRSTTELDSAIGSKLAQNKVSTANLLRIAGLPTPIHAVVLREDEAIDAAIRIGFPLVVKPSDKDRGEGVSVDVADGDSLKSAFIAAQELSDSKQVIIEQQVLGVCHRLYIVEGSLLYAVKRLPTSVFGDGKRTVRQLVGDEVAAQERRPPWIRAEIKPIDELALQALAKAGFTPESVPPNGGLVPLRRIESTEWGGVDEDVTNIVHPDNVSAATEAAMIFGLHVAGIDIISPDISQPWYTNGAIINEVNFAPLFGGAEISRSHIPKFFDKFIDGNGKIPIEVFESEEAALAFRQLQAMQGKRCFLTSADKTIDDNGKEIVMPFRDVKKRFKALILRSDVDALSIVITNEDFKILI